MSAFALTATATPTNEPVCLTADTLGDNSDRTTCNGDLQDIFNNYEPVDLSGITVKGPGNDQTHYQIWNYEHPLYPLILEFEFVGK